ncbi:hypothetical protein ACLB2K_052300 [Fragaria x ananassa]
MYQVLYAGSGFVDAGVAPLAGTVMARDGSGIEPSTYPYKSAPLSTLRVQLSTMELISLRLRVDSELVFLKGLCSERRRLLIRWKAWPTRKVVDLAFGMPSLKFQGILQIMIQQMLHRTNITVTKYKEDIDIMQDLNFDVYRFSISWSRIFPDGTGKVNWKGVAYHNRLINYLLERGITPYANLHHYDLPLALEQEYLGFLSNRVVKDFTDYAEFCFKTYGDRVKNWTTFNEPRVVASLGYDNALNPPARCSKAYGNSTAGNSGTEPYIVAHHLLLSHAAAVQRYREKYQKTQKGSIGILLDFNWFIHPIVYGEYPKTMQHIVGDRLPKFTKEEVKMVKGSIDFVGINQYTAYYMYDPHQNKTKPNALGYQNDWNAGFAHEKNGVLIGPLAYSSWLYQVPWGLYKCVTYIKKNYGNPTVIISENGMDNPGNQTLQEALHDINRIDFYRSYLEQLKKAVDEAANVVGYFAWSLLDNFEWRLGYISRFGIVYVDFTTLKRYPKMSAYWFKKLLTKKKH